jgi:hypothetical protein
VWWKIRPTKNISLDISTYGSIFDTVLAVYSRFADDPLNLIASNDNEPGSYTGNSFLTNINLSAGQTYYIAVAGADETESGPIHLLWSYTDKGIPEPGFMLLIINFMFFIYWRKSNQNGSMSF